MVSNNEKNSTTVLVIEDDPDDFFLTEDVLKSIEGQPYRVSWSGSFESAQQLLSEQEFDVALVDYRIGKKTGLDFISEVGPYYPNCPMILLTGLRSPEIDRAAQAAGAADYLPKELLSAEFLDRTIRYTRQHAERWSLLNSILTTAASGMVAVDLSMQPIVWNVQALQALDINKRFSAVSWDEVAIAIAGLPGEDALPSEFKNRLGRTFEVKIDDVPGVGQVIAFHDISERAETQALLLKAVEDAEQSSHEKSKFLATMSHELRTPLNGVLGMVQVMERGELNDEQRSSLETIKGCGAGLLEMINDLLDLSKIEAGAMKIENTDFDLNDLVENTTKLLAPTAFAKQLELAAFVDPTIQAKLSGDPSRVKQVLINLVGNAIKFTSEGSVAISVQSVTSGGRSMIQFDVTDTGPGIEEHQQQYLFDRFKQLDNSASCNAGGTGLGLALCKEFLAMMGGEIGCDSAPGRGSRFWFRVEAGAADAAQERLANRKRQELAGASLLVVSPEESIRNVVSAYVEALGGEAQFVTSEQEAITAIDQIGCDHIIFDCHGVDGEPTALIDRIKARSETCQIWKLQCRDQHPRQEGCRFDGMLPRPITKASIIKMCQLLQPSARPGAQDDSDGTSAAKPGTHRRLRVLVAEDNVPSQHVAKAMLGSAGYEADIAANGNQVISMVEEGSYDVILMDVCMPGIDGLEATKRIRTLEHSKDIVIIGLTADVTIESRIDEVGMDRHFHKPVDWEQLIAVLGELEDVAMPLAELAPS
ncbi:MAG: response regulator [Hyphomicrobiaceae bacterium]